MESIILLIAQCIQLYNFLIFIRCILSFVQPNPYNPIVRFLYDITDPLLNAVRGAFPFLMQGGMDFSPLVLLFLLHMTANFLINIA